MAWNVEWEDKALKELRKLDKQAQKQIMSYLRERIATTESPRRFGKELSGDKGGLWRYRVGDYRIVCNIEDEKLVVLVLKTGHRKKVYL